MRVDRRAGFTLMELLVVIGIIVLLIAIAVPAVSYLVKGQGLNAAARMVQSAFSDARQRTIATRRAHWVVFYRFQDGNTTRIAFQVYRETEGFVGERHTLPATVHVDLSGSTIRSSGIQIFDGVPDQAAVEAAAGAKFGRFEPDGGIDRGTYDDVPPATDSAGLEIFDPASEMRSVRADTPADLRFFDPIARQVLLVDLTPSNGRVRTRVLLAEGAMPQ